MIDLKLYKRPMAALVIAGDKVRATPGVVAKFSNTLANEGVNIYGISSGEFSIDFYVDEADHDKAKKALTPVVERSAFISLSTMRNIGMITVTGKEFGETPGMLVRLLAPLAKKGINIFSISISLNSLLLFVGWNDTRAAYELVEKQFVKGVV